MGSPVLPYSSAATAAAAAAASPLPAAPERLQKIYAAVAYLFNQPSVQEFPNSSLLVWLCDESITSRPIVDGFYKSLEISATAMEHCLVPYLRKHAEITEADFTRCKVDRAALEILISSLPQHQVRRIYVTHRNTPPSDALHYRQNPFWPNAEFKQIRDQHYRGSLPHPFNLLDLKSTSDGGWTLEEVEQRKPLEPLPRPENGDSTPSIIFSTLGNLLNRVQGALLTPSSPPTLIRNSPFCKPDAPLARVHFDAFVGTEETHREYWYQLALKYQGEFEGMPYSLLEMLRCFHQAHKRGHPQATQFLDKSLKEALNRRTESRSICVLGVLYELHYEREKIRSSILGLLSNAHSLFLHATLLHSDDLEAVLLLGLSCQRASETCEATRCFLKVGNGRAWSELGSLYLQGKQEKMALDCYLTGAHLNCGRSLNALGLIYYFGQLGQSKDEPTGIDSFIKGASLHDADALINLAFIYLTGRKELTREELEQGLACLKESLMHDLWEAWDICGQLYETGKWGFPKNAAIADQCFARCQALKALARACLAAP